MTNDRHSVSIRGELWHVTLAGEKSFARAQGEEGERHRHEFRCGHLSHLGSATRPEERWQPVTFARYYQVLDDV